MPGDIIDVLGVRRAALDDLEALQLTARVGANLRRRGTVEIDA
jgi:hypothetical protein